MFNGRISKYYNNKVLVIDAKASGFVVLSNPRTLNLWT